MTSINDPVAPSVADLAPPLDLFDPAQAERLWEVLAHARMMDYKPATALITTYQNSKPSPARRKRSMLISPEDVPGLLGKVADLISERATRRLERQLRLVWARRCCAR